MGKVRSIKRHSWVRRLHAGKQPDNCLNIPGILCPLNTRCGRSQNLDELALMTRYSPSVLSQ